MSTNETQWRLARITLDELFDHIQTKHVQLSESIDGTRVELIPDYLAGIAGIILSLVYQLDEIHAILGVKLIDRQILSVDDPAEFFAEVSSIIEEIVAVEHLLRREARITCESRRADQARAEHCSYIDRVLDHAQNALVTVATWAEEMPGEDFGNENNQANAEESDQTSWRANTAEKQPPILAFDLGRRGAQEREAERVRNMDLPGDDVSEASSAPRENVPLDHRPAQGRRPRARRNRRPQRDPPNNGPPPWIFNHPDLLPYDRQLEVARACQNQQWQMQVQRNNWQMQNHPPVHPQPMATNAYANAYANFIPVQTQANQQFWNWIPHYPGYHHYQVPPSNVDWQTLRVMRGSFNNTPAIWFIYPPLE